MFKKRASLTALLCSLTIIAAAQAGTVGKLAKKSCSCGFSSINQVGIMHGESDNALSLQTINGFRYKSWFVGLGIGLDTYRDNTVPLFLDLRKNLLAGASTPFLYADGGIQFMAGKKAQKGDFYRKEYNTGAYYDVGIGYYIGLKNRNAILMSAGYSVKQLESDNYTDIVCITYPCPGYIGLYKYRMNRLSVKIGYKF